MKWKKWLYKVVPFKSVRKKLIASYIYQLDEIRQMFLPKRQTSVIDVCAPLYDLVSSLPDITPPSQNTLKTFLIDSRVGSSNTLLKLTTAGREGNIPAFSNYLGGGIFSEKKEIRFADWYSNTASVQNIISVILDQLKEAHVINLLSTQEGDITKAQLVDDIADEAIEFYNSPYFKFVLLDFIELLDILLQGYYGDHYDQARQREG